MAESHAQQPPALLIHSEFHEFDELAAAIEGWDLDWQQLDRGRFHAGVQQMGTSSCLLSRVSFSRQFYQRGGTPPGFMTFGFLRNGVQGVNWCGQRSDSSSLMAFRSGGEYESVSQPGFGANTLSFSEDLLIRAAFSLDLPEVRNLLSGANQIFTCDPELLSKLREKLRKVFDAAISDPSTLSNPGFHFEIESEIPTLLLQAMTSRSATDAKLSSAVRSEASRRALAMIRERSDEYLTVREICDAVEVSERTLHYAFREQLGVSPKQYLQSARLNGARRDLQRSEARIKVADVANRWGFWHMGQFAADYRRQFGELPSETLAARGGRKVQAGAVRTAG